MIFPAIDLTSNLLVRLIPNIYARRLADAVTNRRSASSFLSQTRNDGSEFFEARRKKIKSI
jgi:hypothetical protein